MQQHEAHTDSIIKDQQAYEGKQTLMKRLRATSLLSSASMVFSMAAGPLVAIGLAEFAKSAIKEGFTAAVATAFAAGGGALATLVVGVALGAIAITASYLATRKGQASYIDNAEFNSQENARYIAAALKKEGVCVVPSQQAQTSDTHWQQHIAAEKMAKEALAKAQSSATASTVTTGGHTGTLEASRKQEAAQQNALS